MLQSTAAAAAASSSRPRLEGGGGGVSSAIPIQSPAAAAAAGPAGAGAGAGLLGVIRQGASVSSVSSIGSYSFTVSNETRTNQISRVFHNIRRRPHLGPSTRIY